MSSRLFVVCLAGGACIGQLFFGLANKDSRTVLYSLSNRNIDFW